MISCEYYFKICKKGPYFKSFSMRSTCVMSMRRQQYLLHPSWSIASLFFLISNSPELGGMSYLTNPSVVPSSISLRYRSHRSAITCSCVKIFLGTRAKFDKYLATGEAADRNNHVDFYRITTKDAIEVI